MAGKYSSMPRRNFSLCLAALASLAFLNANAADKPMTFIVGYPAGGATDVLARIIAENLGKLVSVPIIVENKPGAGGRIATEIVKNARPDGNTFLFSISSPMVIYPYIYKKVGYDPIKDFQPVGTIATQTLSLAVGPAVPAEVKTLKEYGDWVKKNPLQATFGAVSGTAPHFAGIEYSRAAGLNLQLTPYKGGNQAVMDLLGGHVPAVITPVAETQPYHASGKLRVLATMGAQRSKILPDIRTMAESGYPQINFLTWTGLFAPAGANNAVVSENNTALKTVLADPNVAASIAKLGMEPTPASPEEFKRLIAADLAFYKKAVAETGFKAED